MIYQVEIGNNRTIGDLTVTYDKYGNKFVGIKEIFQRLQIKSNAKQLAKLETEDISVVDSGSGVCNDREPINYGYKSFKMGKADGIYKFVLNRKNLKPMLFTNHHKPDEKAPEQHIVYLTISSRFKILVYTSNFEIGATFGKSEYAGCAVVVDTANKTADNNQIIRIGFIDKVTKIYKIATIDIDANNKISVNISDAEGKEVGKLKSLDTKYPGSLKFRIRPNEGKLLTYAYVCAADEAGKEAFKQDTYPVNIIEVDSSDDVKPTSYNSAVEEVIYNYHKNNGGLKYELAVLTGDDAENEDFLDKYLGNLVEEHVSAITTIGVNIPTSILKKHKIGSVISYDMETGRSRSKR